MRHLLLLIALFALAPSAFAQKPTHADLAYGDHPRQVLDVWSADTKTPAPLIMYVHGGGFDHGDKSRATERGEGKAVRGSLKKGVSFASINYRFLEHAPLQEIVTDTARAIQYLRSRASELNIDKERIAIYGESAGAGSSLWVGLQDDLADPDSADPIARESTRVRAIGGLAPQATYDFAQWPGMFGLPDTIWYISGVYVGPKYYRLDISKLRTPEGEATRKGLDMLALVSPGDPPVYLRANDPFVQAETWDDMLHHPNHVVKLKERLDAAGVENVAITVNTPEKERTEVFAFLFKHLGVE
jgi:acetyl esterase/lipase